MPWELIAVDNGSTDGTASYLAGVRDMADVPVTVVSNPKNLGFPAAINQGLREARGEYLVLLNNDVVVTDGWLDQLVALANARVGRRADNGGVGERRPTVDGSAGSRDPRPTLEGAFPLGPTVDMVCGCSGASPPPPPGGGARLSVAHSALGLLGLCPTMRPHPSWSRMCPMVTWRRCLRSPGGGATNTSRGLRGVIDATPRNIDTTYLLCRYIIIAWQSTTVVMRSVHENQ